MKLTLRQILVFLLPLALLLGSCEKWELPDKLMQRTCEPPRGDLTAQATERKVALAIANSSGTIDSVFWDFGDGKTLRTTALSTEHTYAAAGDFNVKAVLYNTCGNNNTLAKSVTAFDIGTPAVTLAAENASYRTARLLLTLKGNGNAAIERYGVVYGTTATPDLTTGQKVEKTGSLAVNASSAFDLPGLTPGTAYNVRALSLIHI